MRTTVVTAAFVALVIGAPGRLESQAAGAAASEIIKMGTGALRQSEKNKSAEKDKKNTEKDKDKPKDFDPALCSTSPEAYDKLIQALRAEIIYREVLRDDIAKSKTDQRKYQQCQGEFASDPEFQKIMNRNPPGPSTTPAQFMKTTQKNSEDAQKAMDKKCGEDPMKIWSKKNQEWMLDYLAGKAAESVGMSKGCYAVLKEFADYFCSLPEATQEKAVREGIAIPGGGKAFWVFTPQHASALKPRCARLNAQMEELERGRPR
jgi:hypothetical protein